MLNREKRLKFYMIVKKKEFLFFKIEFSNLAENMNHFKLKYLKFEQDPLNIKKVMAQYVTCAYQKDTLGI